MKKMTKLEQATMLTQMFMYVTETGGRLYTDKDVTEMQGRIKELEAEVALLKAEQPQMPEHNNIRGSEYYK